MEVNGGPASTVEGYSPPSESTQGTVPKPISFGPLSKTIPFPKDYFTTYSSHAHTNRILAHAAFFALLACLGFYVFTYVLQ